MATNLDPMLFSHLRRSDYLRLEQMLRLDSNRDEIIDALSSYLSIWDGSAWLDEEKIHLLGRDFSALCPSQYKDDFRATVRKRVSDTVADVFLAGFDHDAYIKETITGLPSIDKYNNILMRLEKHGFDDRIDAEIDALIKKYLEYTQNSGDADPLLNALIRISSILVKITGPARLRAAMLAERLAQDGLKWGIHKVWLWAHWGRSLEKQGAFEAAELLYWEALRRFSWSSVIRSYLIRLLSTTLAVPAGQAW